MVLVPLISKYKIKLCVAQRVISIQKPFDIRDFFAAVKSDTNQTDYFTVCAMRLFDLKGEAIYFSSVLWRFYSPR